MRVPSLGVILALCVICAALALELGKVTTRISEH